MKKEEEAAQASDREAGDRWSSPVAGDGGEAGIK
jgi:hypothetical protein